MPKVVGEVTQQSGHFIVIDENGKLRQLKEGDKIYDGDKAIAQGGDNLQVTLINNEGITLGMGDSLIFDKSVIGDVFAKEDVSMKDLVLDSVLDASAIDADDVKETAAGGGAQGNASYISGSTAIDRTGQSSDAKANTSSLEANEEHSKPSNIHVDAVSFVETLNRVNPSKTNNTVSTPENTDGNVGLEIVGTDADDSISGDTEDNTIIGGAGDDTLFGNDGSDTITGGSGDDFIDGGSGDDIQEGNEGDDVILGGAGDDTVDGGSDDDLILGENGNDTLIGGEGNDILLGGNGDDTIFGGAGDDYSDGGNGDDTLIDGEGNDILLGGNGDDTIFGGAGDDYIDGGNGNDTLILTGTRDDYTIIENSNGSFTIIDNRQESQGETDTVIHVENFQFSDQTLLAADLVDSNQEETIIATSALDAATEALGEAVSAHEQSQNALNETLASQTVLDLTDPMGLQEAEDRAQSAIDTANQAVVSAEHALSQAQEAVDAAQAALDAGIAAGESVQEETAALETAQNLLANANSAVEQARQTLDLATQNAQSVESHTLNPTLDTNTQTHTDNTPLFEGRAEVGSQVTIIIDGAIVATVVTDESGHWSYESEPLSEGNHTLLLESQDEAGNIAQSEQTTLTIDAQANAPHLEIQVSAVEIVSHDAHTHHGRDGHRDEHRDENSSYTYTLTIEASLTDPNESLSQLILELPQDVTLFDPNGHQIQVNANGTYSFDMQDQSPMTLTMHSDELLDHEELSQIQGTITSTNSSQEVSLQIAQADIAPQVQISQNHESDDHNRHHHRDHQHGDNEHRHEHDHHQDDHDNHGHHYGQEGIDFALVHTLHQHHAGDDTTPSKDLSGLDLSDLLPEHARDNTHIFSDDPSDSVSHSRNDASRNHDTNINHCLNDHETLKIDISIHTDEI